MSVLEPETLEELVGFFDTLAQSSRNWAGMGRNQKDRLKSETIANTYAASAYHVRNFIERVKKVDKP